MQHTTSSSECQGMKYLELDVNWSLNPSIEIQNKLFIDIMVNWLKKMVILETFHFKW